MTKGIPQEPYIQLCSYIDIINIMTSHFTSKNLHHECSQVNYFLLDKRELLSVSLLLVYGC